MKSDWDAVIEEWEIVQEINPLHPEVGSYLTQAKEKAEKLSPRTAAHYLSDDLHSYSSDPFIQKVISRRSKKRPTGWVIDGVVEGEEDEKRIVVVRVKTKNKKFYYYKVIDDSISYYGKKNRKEGASLFQYYQTDSEEKSQNTSQSELQSAEEELKSIKLSIELAEVQEQMIKQQMKIDKLKAQQKYESFEEVEKRRKAYIKVKEKMRKKPIGIISFPISSYYPSYSLNESAFSSGEFYNTPGPRPIDSSWGPEPYDGTTLYDMKAPRYVNVLYLAPELLVNEEEETENLVFVKPASSFSSLQQTDDKNVRTIVRILRNNLISLLKPTHKILNQPFSVHFKVKGIFEAYTVTGNKIDNQELIFFNGNNQTGLSSPGTSDGNLTILGVDHVSPKVL